MYGTINCRIYRELYNHYNYINLQHFLHPKKGAQRSRQSLISSFLPPYIYLLLKFRTIGILHCVFFCAWLLTQSIMFFGSAML